MKGHVSNFSLKTVALKGAVKKFKGRQKNTCHENLIILAAKETRGMEALMPEKNNNKELLDCSYIAVLGKKEIKN